MKKHLTAIIDAIINWINSRAGREADFRISEWWDNFNRKRRK